MFAFHVGCFNVLKQSLQKHFLIFIYLMFWIFQYYNFFFLRSCFAFMRELRGRRRNSGGGCKRRGSKTCFNVFLAEGMINTQHAATCVLLHFSGLVSEALFCLKEKSVDQKRSKRGESQIKTLHTLSKANKMDGACVYIFYAASVAKLVSLCRLS